MLLELYRHVAQAASPEVAAKFVGAIIAHMKVEAPKGKPCECRHS